MQTGRPKPNPIVLALLAGLAIVAVVAAGWTRAPKASERKDASQAAPDMATRKPEATPADPPQPEASELERLKTEKQKADEEIDQLRTQIEERDQAQPSVRMVEHAPEFDVWQDGREGMRIRATVDTRRLRGITCQIRVYIRYVNGAKRDIKSRSGRYADDNGNLVVARNFTPQAQDARVEDLKLFIPLDEIRTPTGTHQLRYVIKIRQNNTHGYLAEQEGEEFTFTSTGN